MRRRRKRHPNTRVLGEVTGSDSTVIVTQTGDRRSFRFADSNELIQGSMHQRGPLDFRSEYLRGHLAASLCCERPARALCLGLGIGAVPRLLSATHPGIYIDCVESNDAVIRAAHEYFGFPRKPNLVVHHARAEDFVERPSDHEQYDLLYIDCYDAAGIPIACANPNFLRTVKGLVSPTGLLVANLLPGRRYVGDFATNFCAEVRSVWSIPCERKSNITLFGSPHSLVKIDDALTQAARVDSQALTPIRLTTELKRCRPWSSDLAAVLYA